MNLAGGSCGVIASDGDNTPGNDVLLAVDPTNAYIRADKSGASLSGGGCGFLGADQIPLGSSIVGLMHNIVWVNTGNSSSVYLDGSLVSTVQVSGSNTGFHNSVFSIGREFDGSNGYYPNGVNYFAGALTDVEYFNQALSAAQVSAINSAGVTNNTTLTPLRATPSVSSSASDQNAQLASALAALQSALQALLAQL